MQPPTPEISAHNAEEEPWRLARLHRADGRARDMMRIATEEPSEFEPSTGERIWSQHVLRLHDDRGVLQLHVTPELHSSAWLSVVALVASRAWGGEEENEVELLLGEDLLPWPLEPSLPTP
jgi:hypothetical protein